VKIGAAIPHTDIGGDAGALREFALAVDNMGFDHIVVYDHVLGADPAAHGDLLYTHKDPFQEAFVSMGYLAGVTRRVGFATGVLVLSQRQAALVAKQAAQVDLLCGGRLRLGVSVGWNRVEQQALGTDFANRGARLEEQIEVMRLLWTQETVTFKGRFHAIEAAGINPRPLQQPIPVWMGGWADGVLRRIGRLADGWFPHMGAPTESHRRQLAAIRSAARAVGRPESAIGIEPHINLTADEPETWAGSLQAWEDLGAGHLFVSTMRGGLSTLAAHLRRLEDFAATVPWRLNGGR
jgi:probable F420-dependent oxidoreductase